MAEAEQTLRANEKRPIYGGAQAASGTLTISGTPTISLYDAAGGIVSGWDGISTDGHDADPAATVRAWKSINAPDLSAGKYVAVFLIAATGSDGIDREYEARVEITIDGTAYADGLRLTLLPLIRRLRVLIGDTASGDCRQFEDLDLQDALDARRQFVQNEPLEAIPTLGGTVLYLTFQACLGDWETDAVLQDARYSALSPATSDYQAGRWTFATQPNYPVFLTGKTFDLYAAAADLLDAWAAAVKLHFSYSPGGAMGGQFNRGQKHAMILATAQEYRAKARPTFAVQVRTDVGDDPAPRPLYDRILRR